MTARRPRPRPGIPLLTGLLTGLLVPSALAAPASAATPQAAATPAPVTTSAPVITPQTLGRLPETGQAPSASPDLLPPLSLESVDPAVVWPGDKFTVSVIVTNQTDATLVDPVVEVWVGWRPVGSRSALADWVYGPIAPDMTPHAVEGLEPLAPGESAPASVTLAIDTLALGEGPRGPREMAVTVFDRGGERPDEPLAQVRTFMIWDPASGATDGTPADNVQVSLIAPLTGPPVRWEPGGADHGSGLTLQEQRPTAEYLEQLASLTRSGNSLGQLLEVAQATGTLHYGPDALALAVDPAVIAAALHSPDPELQAWAEALLETAAPKYRLPAYDPDLAALSRAGLSEYGLSDIVFSPIVPAWEPPEGWGPVLGWPGGAPVPDLETLGTARAASITTAVVEAGLEAHLGTVTGRAEVEVQEGYISALIADATLSELLHRATEVTGPTPLAMSRAEIVQRVLAETAMVSADNFGRDTHLLVVFPRNWNPAVEYLLAPLRALDDAPWVRLAPLDELLATDPPAVSRRPLPFSSSQEGELEVAVVQQLDAARSELDIISTVAEDPSPLRRVLTPGLTSVLSVAWRYQPAERAAAVDEALSLVGQAHDALSITVNAEIMMIAAQGALPAVIRNTLPVDATVVVEMIASDSRLHIAEQPVIVVPAGEERRVTIPVEALASGDVSVGARLLSIHGEPVSATAVMQLRVRAGWETVGTAIIAALLAVLFVLGVFRTVRRGRGRRRGEDLVLADPVIPAEARRGRDA